MKLCIHYESEITTLLLALTDKTEFGTVGSWLTNIGLGQYENVLIINGYDNINMLVSNCSVKFQQ